MTPKPWRLRCWKSCAILSRRGRALRAPGDGREAWSVMNVVQEYDRVYRQIIERQTRGGT